MRDCFLKTIGILALAGIGHHAAGQSVPLQPPKGYVDRSGVRELVVWQSLNGLFTGAMIGSAIFADTIEENCAAKNVDETGEVIGDEAEFEPRNEDKCNDAMARSGGIAGLGLAAGIATPLLVTSGKPVTTADAIMVNRCTLFGLMHGYIIPFAAGIKPLEDKEEIDPDADNVRILAASTAIGDLLGVGMGAYLAREYEPDPGLVSFIGTIHMTTFMAASSVGSAYVDELDQENNRKITAGALLAADLALAAALYKRDRIDLGRNRVFWLDAGGFVGWLGGAGAGSIVGGDDPRHIAIGSTLGLAAGIVITYLATQDSEPWRNRMDLQQNHRTGFNLHPPRVDVLPVRTVDGTLVMAYKAEFLRGTF